MSGLYPRLLGAGFAALPPLLRAVHEKPLRLFGTVTVTRGRSPASRLLASLAGMPRSCSEAPCEVEITAEPGAPDGAERWTRNMAGSRFHSVLSPAGPGEFDESFGWYRFRFRIETVDGGLRFVLLGFRVLGVPVPRFLHPRIVTLESQQGDAYVFAVEVVLPLLGLLIAYRGLLRPA